jgi:hypothetical protein
MADWKTIDTAPKDGTWFLAFYPRKERKFDQIAVARWYEHSTTEPAQFWDAAEHRDDEEPTHWMPLPADPVL